MLDRKPILKKTAKVAAVKMQDRKLADKGAEVEINILEVYGIYQLHRKCDLRNYIPLRQVCLLCRC